MPNLASCPSVRLAPPQIKRPTWDESSESAFKEISSLDAEMRCFEDDRLKYALLAFEKRLIFTYTWAKFLPPAQPYALPTPLQLIIRISHNSIESILYDLR